MSEPVDFETPLASDEFFKAGFMADSHTDNESAWTLTRDVAVAIQWAEEAPEFPVTRVRLVPTGAAGQREFSVCVWCEARVEWTASADRAEAEARLREHSATCPKHPAVIALNTPAREPVADELVAGELARWSRRAQDAVLYARAVCQSNGYALAVHGSLRRDIDVVAVPWTAEAVAPDVLAKEILDFLVRADVGLGWASGGPNGTEKPHGRHAWNIVLAGEPFMYLDLSVVSPHPPTPEAGTVTEGDIENLRHVGRSPACGPLRGGALLDLADRLEAMRG